MTPLSASAITSQLAAAERRQVVGMFSGFDDRERAMARQLLAKVDGEARIDPSRFAEDVRERARAEAVAENDRRSKGEPWRFAVRALMNEHQLAEFKRLVEFGTAPDAAARRVMESGILARLDGIAERMRAHGELEQPDDDLDEDDEEPAKPKRRGVRRRRPRTAEDGSDALPARVAAPKPRERVSAPLSRLGRYYGPRAFGPDGPIGPEPDSPSFRPPWLIDNDADAERDAA